jgi:uncharacterized protein YecE (DUF72 family)
MSATSTCSKIRVGPAGWSYSDWHGIVYPHPKPPGFHEAAYLAQFFDTIEINTSFYQPPRPDMVRAWLRRVERNPAFMFTAKLWRGFTHERNATLQDEKLFKQGVAPLLEAARFGALLLQFPWSFKNQRENHEYLGGLFLRFREYPLVLEVRHASWNRPDIFKWLAERGVGICNIDQPVIGSSIAPSDRAIPQSGIGYVRLHGRNYEHWFTSNERPEERYNYLYTWAELEPWVDRIKSLAQCTDVTYVITNNHYQGKAIANALQLVSLLRGQPVRVPGSLRQHYPELEKIAAPESLPSEPRQADLLFEPSTAGTK